MKDTFNGKASRSKKWRERLIVKHKGTTRPKDGYNAI
jgi:hypothetical protein